MEIYPKDVRFVYHHFPRLSSEFSVILAESMEAAGAQNKFWELHSQFLEDPPANAEELIDSATEINIDIDLFTYDIEYGKYLSVVIADYEDAKDHGVEHSSLFINNKEFTKEPTIDNLINEIEKELDRIQNNG